MPKPEQNFYRNVVRPALQDMRPHITFDRIENKVGDSVPDITYSSDKGHGWIELKIGHITDWCVVKLPTMTERQRLWLREHYRMCGRVWVMASCGDGGTFLYRGDGVGKVHGVMWYDPSPGRIKGESLLELKKILIEGH